MQYFGYSPLGHRPDVVRPHHLVVLVLDDVAVPDIQASDVEPGLDAGDLVRIGDDRVLEARLPGFRRSGGSAERLPVDDLELHQVDVDGVGVGREIVDLPRFGGADGRVLADVIHPQQRVAGGGCRAGRKSD